MQPRGTRPRGEPQRQLGPRPSGEPQRHPHPTERASGPARPDPAEPALGAPALFVATTLDAWESHEPAVYTRDVTLGRQCYRRLDPQYHAWLTARMNAARAAHESGKLPGPAFERLRRAFALVHLWATRYIGPAALEQAQRTLAAGYQPPGGHAPTERGPEPHPESPAPAGHCFPPTGRWPFHRPVTQEALALVDAVREQALKLGWTEAALYQNRGRLRFPCGPDYGLVCFVGGKRRIGEVTARFITIARPGGSTLRFPAPGSDTSRPAPVGSL